MKRAMGEASEKVSRSIEPALRECDTGGHLSRGVEGETESRPKMKQIRTSEAATHSPRLHTRPACSTVQPAERAQQSLCTGKPVARLAPVSADQERAKGGAAGIP